jgi:FtsH-binding integral membrane protein
VSNALQITQFLHSWTRWIFIVIAVVAIVYFVMGLVQQKPWVKQAQTFLTIFSSFIGLQWIIGLVLFLLYQIPAAFGIRHQWEHLVTMTIVLAVAHVHFSWRRRDMPDARRWRNGLLLMVGVLVLIFVGISVLPAVIQWRFYLP